MSDILPILLTLSPVLPKTACRQLACIVVAILAMTGRITQLGISRWTDKGGSYRTIQRFFQTELDWLLVNWCFFLRFVWDRTGVYLLAGDETVIGKSGKKTFGLDRFFASLAGRAIPGLACFSLALIHVGKRHAYSLCNEQVLRTQEEKQQAKKRRPKGKPSPQTPAPKKARGRPQGSKNKDKTNPTLSPELERIQAQAQRALTLIQKRVAVVYFVLDGHFGNHLAAAMVRQLGLHLISKMRADAALYQEPTALQKQLHPRQKYGDRIAMATLPEAWLRSRNTQDGYQTEIYQGRCWHKQFPHRLNVVIVKKTHLASGREGHVILFSTDLFLTAATLLDYYALRFQIEFTFRDAKQHFGLEDFMGVTQKAVQNAIGLSLFMRNLSLYLLEPLRLQGAGAGIHDLKSWYRGRFYASFLLKMLPQQPDTIICERLVEQICQLGCIHPKASSADGWEMVA